MISVVDANILISALLGSKRVISCITSEKHEFYAPEVIVNEIRKYKADISKRAGYSSAEFDIGLSALLAFVKTVKPEDYDKFLAEAENAIRKRDVKDADYVACALAIRADFIWTNDKDFSHQRLVPFKRTGEF